MDVKVGGFPLLHMPYFALANLRPKPWRGLILDDGNGLTIAIYFKAPVFPSEACATIQIL